MDTRTGRIYQQSEVDQMPASKRAFMKPMALSPTAEQQRTGRVGRNDPCPCGSGKKFKRCCKLAKVKA